MKLYEIDIQYQSILQEIEENDGIMTEDLELEEKEIIRKHFSKLGSASGDCKRRPKEQYKAMAKKRWDKEKQKKGGPK